MDRVYLRPCFEFEHDLVFNHDVSSEEPRWPAAVVDSNGDLAVCFQSICPQFLGKGMFIDGFDEPATQSVVDAVEDP